MSIDLSKIAQFGIKAETTPGVMATLSESNYGLEFDPDELTVDGQAEKFEVNVASETLDSQASINGKNKGNITISGMLKASGALNTEAKVVNLLRASRCVSSSVYAYSVSSAVGTVQPIVDIVTGGTSGATGRVVYYSGTTLMLADVSGTFVSGEALNASVSGWACTTTSATFSQSGLLLVPMSTDASEVGYTATVNKDGIVYTVYGSAATTGIALTSSAVPKFTTTINGIMDADTWGTEVDPVSGVSYEDHAPEVVANASLTVDGTTMELVSSVNIDLGNTVTMVDDLNSDTWLSHAQVSARSITGSIAMLRGEILRNYGLYQKFIAGTLSTLKYTIGTGAGNLIDIIVPNIQRTGVSESDSNGNIMVTQNFTARSIDKKDNALGIWFH